MNNEIGPDRTSETLAHRWQYYANNTDIGEKWIPAHNNTLTDRRRTAIGNLANNNNMRRTKPFIHSSLRLNLFPVADRMVFVSSPLCRRREREHDTPVEAVRLVYMFHFLPIDKCGVKRCWRRWRKPTDWRIFVTPSKWISRILNSHPFRFQLEEINLCSACYCYTIGGVKFAAPDIISTNNLTQSKQLRIFKSFFSSSIARISVFFFSSGGGVIFRMAIVVDDERVTHTE